MEIRKVQKSSRDNVLFINIPAEMANYMEVEKGDNVTIELRGKEIIIKKLKLGE